MIPNVSRELIEVYPKADVYVVHEKKMINIFKFYF